MRTMIRWLAGVLLVVAAGCGMGPRGPFCQSCAMPMDRPELLGTEAGGAPSMEYCIHCYDRGQFTAPRITMEQMLEKCVKEMVGQKIMSEPAARELMAKHLPQLKRWKKS